MKVRSENRTFSIVFLIFSVVTLAYTDDYQYDYDEEIQIPSLDAIKLRKCNCKANEVFINGTCFPEENTTVEFLSLDGIFQHFNVNTSSFQVIENSGMKCGFKKYLTRINPRDLFILSTGELFHPLSNDSYSPFEFCVDHVLDEQNQVTWEIQMCLESIEIPVCCSLSRREQKYCKNPHLPIGFGFSLLKDASIKTLPGQNIQCNENETYSLAEISDPNNPTSSVYISYHDQITQLVVYSSTDHNSLPRYLNRDEFCVIPQVKNNKVKYEIGFCDKDPILEHQIFCEDFSCVRKCCPQHHLYSYPKRGCVPVDGNAEWRPTFHRMNDSTPVEEPDFLKLSFGFPICKRSYYPFQPDDPDDTHILMDNGEIYVFRWKMSVSTPRYCMDNFILNDNKIVETTLTCFPDEPPTKTSCSKVKYRLFPILLGISCVFLLITLIVYASIPELHAKLHGKSLLSHVTALFVAYLSLAVVQWMATRLSMNLCRIFAFVIQISFLGSFFWLSVMCFDIWWTLRSMRPVADTSDSSRRRFVYYSIYAWGCPLIIGSVTLAMEMLPNTKEYAYLIQPGFGRKSCWFADNAALWFYFYSFISILTLANVVFFVRVAIILIQAHRANNGILRTTSKQNQERIWLYLKLFIVMGITWICEVVSWQEGSCEYWIFTDVINALQGFFIFLIFICKKNIFAKLRTRGSDSTRKLRRMVQGSSYYASSSQVTQQSSLDSTRKFSANLQHHLSKLSKFSSSEDNNENKK